MVYTRRKNADDSHSNVPVQPSDRRKSGLSLGHLARVRRGQAPLINRTEPVEQALAAHTTQECGLVKLEELQKAVTKHRDAFKAEPQRALLRRPGPTYQVHISGHGTQRAHLQYDLEGRVAIGICDPLRAGSPYTLPPEGKRTALSDKDLHRINEMRQTLEEQHLYSTASIPLAICRSVRRARQLGTGDGTFQSALASLDIPAEQLLSHYGGGTCFTLAEALRDRIQRDMGISAHVVSSQIANFVLKRPNMRRRGEEISAEVLRHLQADAHVDVIVPHFDKDGQVCYAQFVVGGGLPMNEAMRVAEPDIVERDEGMRKKHLIPQERIIDHPSRLAVDSAVGPLKLNIMRRGTKETFGIDLVRRIAYLNEAATPAGQAGVQVDLASPEGRSELSLFLAVVRQQFALDHEAIADLRFLCENMDAFCDEVLAGPTRALQVCIHERDAAVIAAEPAQRINAIAHMADFPSSVQMKALFKEAEECLTNAAKHATEGSGDLAKAQYSRGAQLFDSLNNRLAVELASMRTQDIESVLEDRHVDKHSPHAPPFLWNALRTELATRRP